MKQAAGRVTYCAAIDLGATSGRVILGRWSGGRLATREVHRFRNAPITVGPHAYWETGTLWSEIQAGLVRAASALPRGARLASVGVDAWGNDHVLVDRQGRAVFPVHAYRDRRTEGPLRRWQGRAGDLARLYAATGVPLGRSSAALQLEEIGSTYPGLRQTASRCLFIAGYFSFLLSGRMENELTIASTSQLLAVRGMRWSGEAMAAFGVPQAWFPPPVRSGMRLGVIKSGAGPKGVQVIAVPGHDTACAYEALPASCGGDDLLISSGTWSIPGFESSEPLLGSAARLAGVANERRPDGGYRPSMLVPGLWALERILRDFAASPATAKAWKELLGAAEKHPAPTLRLDLAHVDFLNPPSMRMAVDRHLSRRGATAPQSLAGYVRLVCDSIADGHARAKRALEAASGRRFRRILVSGGGARNRLVCRATAEAAGVPVLAYAMEASALGNLGHQLMALGAIGSGGDLRRAIADRVRPDAYVLNV